MTMRSAPRRWNPPSSGPPLLVMGPWWCKSENHVGAGRFRQVCRCDPQADAARIRGIGRCWSWEPQPNDRRLDKSQPRGHTAVMRTRAASAPAEAVTSVPTLRGSSLRRRRAILRTLYCLALAVDVGAAIHISAESSVVAVGSAGWAVAEELGRTGRNTVASAMTETNRRTKSIVCFPTHRSVRA
jgi:hypothetical protein